jgi:diguanylate cyclase (GGDEF)-like protein
MRRQLREARVQRMAELRLLLERAETARDASALRDLRDALGQLHTVTALLGFERSGELAKQGERLLELAANFESPTLPMALPGIMGDLAAALEAETAELTVTAAMPLTCPLPTPQWLVSKRGRACIVAERRTTVVDALERELTAAGFIPHWLQPFTSEACCVGSTLALVDVEAGGDGYALCRRIAETQSGPGLRILYSEGNRNFDLFRMAASRAHRMIHRPFELRTVLRPESSEPQVIKAKIVIVGSQMQNADAVASMLAPSGHTVRVVSEPGRFFEEMNRFRPELLLLDCDSFEVSGHELARIVRSDARHELVPIVFMESRDGREERRAARRAGADDYLTKPVTAEELEEVVETQLRRNRILRKRLEADGLTDLLNRGAALIAVDELLHVAERNQQFAILAIVDIDHFKRVNDELGHPTGDRVLREMAGHLRAQLEPGDVAGRLGGEELLVAFAGNDKDKLIERIGAIRESMRIELRGNDGGFLRRVTISAGCAIFPTHGTQGAELLRKADQALIEAKRLGRNRVGIAD